MRKLRELATTTQSSSSSESNLAFDNFLFLEKGFDGPDEAGARRETGGANSGGRIVGVLDLDRIIELVLDREIGVFLELACTASCAFSCSLACCRTWANMRSCLYWSGCSRS